MITSKKYFLFICLLFIANSSYAELTYPDGNKKAVVFSFDDGMVQDRRLVSLLDKYKVKGTFNLSSGLFSQHAPWLKEYLAIKGTYVHHDEVAVLYKRHEIAGHSFSHPGLPGLPQQEIQHQVESDKERLSLFAGYTVTSFAYPLGLYDDEVIQTLKQAGFTNARTVNSTLNFELPENLFEWHPSAHHSDAYPLAKKYVENKTDSLSVFVIWGHSWEFDQNIAFNNWDYFESILKVLSEETNIWFTTAGEFAEFYHQNSEKMPVIPSQVPKIK
ncbi:polysaccharide deacetylase family protein [Alteromonas sp. MMG017]|uniref:polysaccharide deacetylase family protein n=1 Tax=Alteromonas sp. MMG017 TaxID=2822692 RepID=UPI001B3A644A|nr:polysaccharide deacetylase family protein [Alteromonas sp. MMG017]MBQ4830060.1 polysaccharide deacetylase family protein [Alteromonas sp. MMG017]